MRTAAAIRADLAEQFRQIEARFARQLERDRAALAAEDLARRDRPDLRVVELVRRDK